MLYLVSFQNHYDDMITLDEYDSSTTIYDIKTLLSPIIKIPICDIHILDENDENNKNNNKYMDHSTKDIEQDSILRYHIVKNRCATCGVKSAQIVGNCSYCISKFCLNHRLPEYHACVNMSKCKEHAFNRNSNKVMSEKCVNKIIK